MRGSTRSRGAAIASALTLRQLSAALPPERTWGLWLSRRIVAGVMGAFGPTLSGTTVDKVDTRTPAGHGVAGEWVSGPGARRVDAAIYYIHGSGYALCSPRTHRRLTAWLSRLTKLPIFSVDYPLAPRHRFPAAADDVHAGWEWLLSSTGLPPDRVIVAGDSAGGHLAVDLMLHGPLASRSAALVLFSRLVDLTLSLARARERLHRDPAIRAADAARLVQLYCRGVDPAHPRLALDVTRGPVLPPTLIQAGGAEFLSADAHRLAADIRTAGGDCELQVWPDQAHVFQALPRLTPEAAQAMRYVAAFISGALIDSGSGAAGIEQTG
jgi:monoterpene epsilon-lactone hydrolase